MDRYYRVQELAFRRSGPKGPADPGFKPMSDDELVALGALVTTIEELRRARCLGRGGASGAWLSFLLLEGPTDAIVVVTMGEGKSYELLAQQVYRHIVNRERSETVDVQHNVKLEGRSGLSHQIDVYWQVDVGGVVHRVVVEARDRSRAAEKDHVFAFAGKVNDLPRGTVGIMVSRKGFQSGAVVVARESQILLAELREPQPDDWDGLIKSVEIRMRLLAPQVHVATPRFDMAWAETQKVRLGFSPAEKVNVQVDLKGPGQEGPRLYGEDGSERGTLLQALHRSGLFGDACERQHREVPLDGLFARTNAPAFPLMKLSGCWIDFEVSEHDSRVYVDGGDFVDVVLKSVSEGGVEFLSKKDLGGTPSL